jgi:hypothetical protein
MKIEHADNHPAVESALAEQRRIEGLHADTEKLAAELWERLNDKSGAQVSRFDAMTADILAGGDGKDAVRTDRDALAEERSKAEERAHALRATLRTVRMRTEQARSVAGIAIAKELSPTLEKHRKRIRAAVAQLHEAARESVDLHVYLESQGYRVPAGAIPMISLSGYGGTATCDMLEHWLEHNPA